MAVAFAAGFVLRDVEWTRPYGDPISVAIVQGATPQNEKLLGESVNKVLENYRVLAYQADGADLIVWPEATIPEPIDYHVDFLREVHQEVSAKGSALMLGAIRTEPNQATGENEYFNSVLVLDRRTAVVGWHDKHHLVPFTEFLPLPEFILSRLKRMNLPYLSFHRGAEVPPHLEAAGQRIVASVCFEDAYGATQLRSLQGATMLVNVTNDSWFGQSTARYQHLQITRMRAREAGRSMIRAANDGVSAVIDVRGDIQATALEYSRSVLRASVPPYTGLTPYARIGNWPVIFLAFLFVGVSVYLGASRRRGGTR